MTTPFDVIPAIDLSGRCVVRLEQGDFERRTLFSDDPRSVARGFAAAGARWLHVVDLDGARAGAPRHLETVQAIASAAGGDTRIEAAGGIRSANDVAAVLAAGARRVVFGTAAITNPALVRSTIETHGPNAVAVAVDVRDGAAVGDAWRPGGWMRPADDLIRTLADAGVTLFEVTAIDRDGLLGGPDLALLESLVRIGRGGVIASGGIRGLHDVRATRNVGCVGAIVGRAIYDGTFDLAPAIAALEEST
ncbi:MAG TPA: 1-(5-phosphoribosyl)-5-[(5-phosphoribosylamino)methylideneamino] imidazole-4-carboxamide isomerase [Candidatus Limnocylindrales bacterium]|nr:1-(5-phosphoribosyl)-5-[(5-phosphoribosylamino)methylideneamino] imidazole-4-carboxamide isomerase [Candidatus Limnocylindrales bacterium]